MNKELEQFLDFMVKPESINDVNNYVENKIIFEKGLTLCCNYSAGIGSIIGTVQGQPVTVHYNHFHYPESFMFKVDDSYRVPPVSLYDLKQFFIAFDIAKNP